MTTLPGLAATRWAKLDVLVAVVGRTDTADELRACVPRRWVTRHFPTLQAVGEPDLLVLGDATPSLVVTARLLYPLATIVGMIDGQAPARVLVDVLRAGADACVRTGAVPTLAGHLLAGHRRRGLLARAAAHRSRAA